MMIPQKQNIGTFLTMILIGVVSLFSSCKQDTFRVNNGVKSNAHYYFSRTLSNASEKIAFVKTNISGEIFVFGYFKDTIDFSYETGTSDIRTSAGDADAFLTKFDANGTPLWTRTFGDIGQEVLTGISFTAAGDIIAVGRFTGSVDFDLSGVAPDIQTGVGINDSFIMKISAVGQKVWVKTIGGAGGRHIASDVVVAGDGNIYVSGSFCDTADFDPGVAVVNLTGVGCDGYFAKLDSAGNYLAARNYGGVSYDWGYRLFADSSDNVFMAFGNIGATFTYQGFSAINNGGGDIGVMSLDSSADLRWGNMFGTTGWDGGSSLALDSEGNNYFVSTVTASSNVDFNKTGTGAADIRTSKGLSDIAITKISNSGTYMWTKMIGSTGSDSAGLGVDLNYAPVTANAISITSDGKLFIVGTFTGTVDFSLKDTGAQERTAINSTDGFVLELDASTGEFIKVKTYDLPSGASITMAITVGQKTALGQDIWVYGVFKGTDINLNSSDAVKGTPDLHSSASAIVNDFFFTKMRW